MPLKRCKGRKLPGILTLLVIFSISLAVVALSPAVSASINVTASVDPEPPDFITLGDTARVTLNVSTTSSDTERLPIDVMHIIDISSSMADDNKLSDAKDAAIAFNGFFGSVDRIGVVSYSATASVIESLGSESEDSAIKTQLNADATEYTNIGDAIAEATAHNEILSSGDQSVKVELLLTDGRANRPNGLVDYYECPADVEYAIDKAWEAAYNDTIIFTIGLGPDVNETMLQHIADITGGEYYYAANGSDLQTIYEAIWNEITAIANQMHVYYVLSDDVVYAGNATIAPNEITGNTLRWDIESLTSATPWTVSFDVLPTEGGDEVPINLGLGSSAVIYGIGADTTGKVTGGGCWILSPEDPAEKVTFGFVAQLKTLEEPSGNLEFQDHATGMNLHSESIDYFTATGNTATFSGTARVNGTSGYNFTFTVVKTSEDTFEIWINITGETFTYSANGTLGGGNIKIHAPTGSEGFPELRVNVNRPPVAIATANPSEAVIYEEITFDGSESSDPDNDNITYGWDFDDGYTATGEMEVDHFFRDGSETGWTYTATLTVTDEHGAPSDPTAVDVTIFGNMLLRTPMGRYIGQPVGIKTGFNCSNVTHSVTVTVDGVETWSKDGLTSNVTSITWVPLSSGNHTITVCAYNETVELYNETKDIAIYIKGVE